MVSTLSILKLGKWRLKVKPAGMVIYLVCSGMRVSSVPGTSVAMRRYSDSYKLSRHGGKDVGYPSILAPTMIRILQYHRRKAYLRILDVEETKRLPYRPRSYPFIEQLIGTMRREFLDPGLLSVKPLTWRERMQTSKSITTNIALLARSIEICRLKCQEVLAKYNQH